MCQSNGPDAFPIVRILQTCNSALCNFVKEMMDLLSGVKANECGTPRLGTGTGITGTAPVEWRTCKDNGGPPCISSSALGNSTFKVTYPLGKIDWSGILLSKTQKQIGLHKRQQQLGCAMHTTNLGPFTVI